MVIRKSHQLETVSLMISLTIHLLLYLAFTISMTKEAKEYDKNFGFMEVDFLKLKNIKVIPRKRPNMQIIRPAILYNLTTTAPTEGGSQVDQKASPGAILPLPIRSKEEIPSASSTVAGLGTSSPNNTLHVPIWSHGQRLWQIEPKCGAENIQLRRRFKGAPTDRGKDSTFKRFIENEPEEIGDIEQGIDPDLGMNKFLEESLRKKRVVYCLDISASMYEPRNKISAAVIAVKNSIRTLNSFSRFNVIVFASRAKKMNDKFMIVNTESRNSAYAFLEGHLEHPSDYLGTDILTALSEACNGLPTDIILVTDGWASGNPENPGSVVTNPFIISTRLKALNLSHARLYTIGIGISKDSSTAHFLQRLALENNGGYKFPPIR